MTGFAIARFLALTTAAISICETGALAQDTNAPDLQRDARISWAAYRCAAFSAVYSDDDKDQVRLIQIAYEHGTKWFAAARDGRHFNYDKTTPDEIVQVAIKYRSTDYSLGRIEEIARDSVWKQLDFYFGGIEKSTMDRWQAAAKSFYDRGNCDAF